MEVTKQKLYQFYQRSSPLTLIILCKCAGKILIMMEGVPNQQAQKLRGPCGYQNQRLNGSLR